MNRSRSLVLAALALVGAAGCRPGGGAAGPFPGAPVVVISIDTLRSDRLPVYGYDRVATPAIDALARDGIVFERAYTHVPLTLPAHLSMFTGLLPGDHGVRDNLGYRFDAERHPYLPRLFAAAGYATGGAISAYVLRAETGFAAGFEFFEGAVDLRSGLTLGRSQRPCGETLAASRDWLRRVAAGRFFYFGHFYEPHTPWEAPEPFRSRYGDPYDAEIAAADACVGELVEELRRLDVLDRAIVVLTSDHGEGLGDHGEQEHGILLYREALQVPLVLRLPGAARAGTRISAPAQLLDLAPTLLRLTALEPPAGLAGSHLLEALPEERPIYAETFYPRLHMGWSELTAVIAGRWHGIFGPDPELYDLIEDPAERRNLRDGERRRFAELREQAATFERPLAAPAAEDAETAAKLAALGYLGGAATGATTGPLPDPKSKLPSLREFGRALQDLTERQDYRGAAARLERVLAENPRMVDAWDSLGLALHRLGRSTEALAAYEKAMEISGGTPHVALAVGQVLLDLGRGDEARAHAELALAASPAAAHSLVAQVDLAAGRLEAAEAAARRALAARGSRIGPLLVLAQVQRAQGELEAALATCESALADLAKMQGEQKFAGLYFVHGDLLARLDRPHDAVASLRREIALFPAEPRAYAALAALYAAHGQPDDAVGTLRALVEGNPDLPVAYAEAVKTLRVLGDPQGAAGLLAAARRRFPDEPALTGL